MAHPREKEMRALVERFTLHGAIHALVEVCYRHSAELDENRGRHPNRKSENWRKIARLLSAIETEAWHLDF